MEKKLRTKKNWRKSIFWDRYVIGRKAEKRKRERERIERHTKNVYHKLWNALNKLELTFVRCYNTFISHNFNQNISTYDAIDWNQSKVWMSGSIRNQFNLIFMRLKQYLMSFVMSQMRIINLYWMQQYKLIDDFKIWNNS